MNKPGRHLLMAAAACAGLALVACVGVGFEFPQGLSGEWTFTMDPDFRGNHAVVDGTIKQTDTELSVQTRDGVEMLGTVKDREVSWGFTVPARENSPALTAKFTGTVAASGDAIEGTWHLIGMAGGDLDGEFRATKKSN